MMTVLSYQWEPKPRITASTSYIVEPIRGICSNNLNITFPLEVLILNRNYASSRKYSDLGQVTIHVKLKYK
jgi:hypothetical protein